MVSGFGVDPNRAKTMGIDRTTLRLAILGVIVFTTFIALFSRLWFLQVLASEQYSELARENRVRRVHSEPPRGDIVDRHGRVLVTNRTTTAVTVDKQIFENRRELRRVLRRLSVVLDVPVQDLRTRLNDVTVSPYKPVAVANDVRDDQIFYIRENPEDFPGVGYEKLPIRKFPHGRLGAHVFGYVGEISPEALKSSHFKKVRPRYQPGDIVGRDGVEYTYDRWLRGTPRIEKFIVTSTGRVVEREEIQQEDPGYDLYLTIDARIQKLAEESLEHGIQAARSEYQAPAGAVVVMDPRNGEVIALASHPDYDPSLLADGITNKEFASLGAGTEIPDDDALFNRAIAGQRQPGSTYKVVTAGAALASGVASPYDRFECSGSKVYPPEGGPGSVVYHNWTPTYFGYIDFPKSLEISCDTFYYELGWRLETAFGPPESAGGDGTERFQKYARTAGMDHETGIDLPNEAEGRVPDLDWCKANEDIGYCPYGWLPGYTVNMAIGQGDLIVTPIQMAVTYAAIANGGIVWEPRLGLHVAEGEGEDVEIVHDFKSPQAARLPLDEAELGVIREGLERVVVSGTARSAFLGYPMESYPIAGKTGTAELGETDLNDAWFVSYGPAPDPRYVIAVYVEKAGHGGESAAPIARQIWEGIFGVDEDTNVRLGTDFSG